MSKICFTTWHYNTPELFLDILRRMTPKQSGKWKDMEAVTDHREADFIIVFDGCHDTTIDLKKTIYVGQHPLVEGHSCPSFRDFEDKGALATIRLDKYWNTGEVWLKHDYDYLSGLKVFEKPKHTVCIMTYQTINEMYKQRVTFMKEYFKSGLKADLYGRPEDKFIDDAELAPYYKGPLGKTNPDGYSGDHMEGKEGLVDYKYSLEFDVGPTKNYISERFYDSMLLWCHPFYFGSTNVSDIMPEGSFTPINIEKPAEAIELIKESLKQVYNVEAAAEARYLLLNKYQTWPYIYDVINNISKYQGA